MPVVLKRGPPPGLALEVPHLENRAAIVRTKSISAVWVVRANREAGLGKGKIKYVPLPALPEKLVPGTSLERPAVLFVHLKWNPVPGPVVR